MITVTTMKGPKQLVIGNPNLQSELGKMEVNAARRPSHWAKWKLDQEKELKDIGRRSEYWVWFF